MKIVVDCNVLFSAAWNDGISRKVVRHVVENCSMIVSPAIAAEYRRIGERHGSPARRDVYVGIVSIILHQATMIADRPCPFELPDPDDLPLHRGCFEQRGRRARDRQSEALSAQPVRRCSRSVGPRAGE